MNTKANFESSAYDGKFFTMHNNLNFFERIIYHCPDCFNFPLLKINSDLINASCSCDKNHKYENISLNELYHKLIDSSINLDSNNLAKNVICFKCKKSCEKKDSLEDLSKILDEFGFCHGCDKIICSSCIKLHEENEKKKDPIKHKLVPLDKYVNFCPLHRNRYSAYCYDCKKNTCLKCTEHKQHKKYHFDDYLLLDDDVKKYKKDIIDLRTNCENLENQMNLILEKIRNDFHENMQKQLDILKFNEFLLDAYQTNQFNYFYLQNVLNNFSNLDFIHKQMNDQDIKKKLIEMIQNINLSDIFDNFNIEHTKEGELLNVSQPQTTKKIDKIDYNKDTENIIENPTFGKEENQFNNDKNNYKLLEVTDLKQDSTKYKNTEKINNKDEKENEINNNLNINNNKSKRSFQESIMKENGLENLINVNQSYTNEIKREDINLNDVSIKSLRIGNVKLSCEFVGKNYSSATYKLKELPNNIEASIEIKNNCSVTLPKGCYLFDENNCSSLMLLDNQIGFLEPGKTCYKKIKFEIYIYSKGNYDVKLGVKDPNGNYISNNKFEYSLVIE